MGDCRCRISISSKLLDHAGVNFGKDFYDSVHVVSSDTTVRELAEMKIDIQGQSYSILSFLSLHAACLWDCTRYPVVNISSWPLSIFSESRGSKSKTLYDAGWFPGGRLFLLATNEDTPSASHCMYDESTQTECLPQHENVQLIDGSRADIKPSELLASVTDRFKDTAQTEAKETELAVKVRRENKISALQKERIRSAKLEENIAKLETQGNTKNASTSRQVQNMLIKSRAAGCKKLSVQDRIYFRIFVIGLTTSEQDYRFFSPQDTVGKILAEYPSPGGQLAEFLVQIGSPPRHCKLSILMRLHEGKERKWLKDVNRVVIRHYNTEHEDASPSAEDPTSNIPNLEPQIESKVLVNEECDTNNKEKDVRGGMETNNDLFKALKKIDAFKRWRAKSGTAVKVRQMKMKSKAKGDAKRVPMGKRFFVELVTIKKSGEASSETRFMATSDNWERLAREGNPKSPPDAWEIYIPGDIEGEFRRIHELQMSVEVSAKAGYVQEFDMVVLREQS